MQSEEIGELAKALSIVQGKLEGAKKEGKNPFFKSKYATLESSWDCCRKQLSENQLSVVQTTGHYEKGVKIITTLLHSSGQWIQGALDVPAAKQDAQGVGICITYGRRYALQAIIGICPDDDDAEGAMNRKPITAKINPSAEKPKPSPKALLMTDLITLMKDKKVSKEGIKEKCVALKIPTDAAKLSVDQLKTLIAALEVFSA